MLARGDMPLLRFMGRRPTTEQAVLARLSSGLQIGEAYARQLSELCSRGCSTAVSDLWGDARGLSKQCLRGCQAAFV